MTGTHLESFVDGEGKIGWKEVPDVKTEAHVAETKVEADESVKKSKALFKR